MTDRRADSVTRIGTALGIKLAAEEGGDGMEVGAIVVGLGEIVGASVVMPYLHESSSIRISAEEEEVIMHSPASSPNSMV